MFGSILSYLYHGLAISHFFMKFIALTSSNILVHDTPRESRESKFSGLNLVELMKQEMDFKSWSFSWRHLPKILQLSLSSYFSWTWAYNAKIASLFKPLLMKLRANAFLSVSFINGLFYWKTYFYLISPCTSYSSKSEADCQASVKSRFISFKTSLYFS